MELIQTKLNLYLPNDDVVRESRPYNIFKEHPNLVIASLTNISVTSSAIRNIKLSLISFNYSAENGQDQRYANPDEFIRVEKIDNSGFTLEYISFGVDCPVSARPYSNYSYYTNSFSSAVFKISSPEINKRFPGIDIAVLCDPYFFMRQLQTTKTLEGGILPIKYYYKNGGLYLDKLRVLFDDENNVKGNQLLLDYSKKRTECSFVSRKKLVPGKLYSSTRTNYGSYYIYLGDFKDCLTIPRWNCSLLFDWGKPNDVNYVFRSAIDYEHGGSLILEFSSFNTIDFDLKDLNYLTAIKTIVSYHNNLSAATAWGGLTIKVVPESSLLRGIELDDFIKMDGLFSPEEMITNYVDENIADGNFEFPGYNLTSSLVWGKVKGNSRLVDSLITKFAIEFIQRKNYGKYVDFKSNFQTITGISESTLDNKIKDIEQKINSKLNNQNISSNP